MTNLELPNNHSTLKSEITSLPSIENVAYWVLTFVASRKIRSSTPIALRALIKQKLEEKTADREFNEEEKATLVIDAIHERTPRLYRHSEAQGSYVEYFSARLIFDIDSAIEGLSDKDKRTLLTRALKERVKELDEAARQAKIKKYSFLEKTSRAGAKERRRLMLLIWGKSPKPKKQV